MTALTPAKGDAGAPGRDFEGAHAFPDSNPNPVMGIGSDGRLTYANASSAALAAAMGLELGAPVEEHLLATLRAHADDPSAPGLEVKCLADHRIFLVTAVPVPGTDAINLYGSDITAAKVVERFPDRNPNPVLRVDADGVLIYANPASLAIVDGLNLAVGRPLPRDLVERVARAREGEGEVIEVRAEGAVFEIRPVDIPEFGFTNLYGTDVTANRAVDKFPNLNPNPVLRITREGRLQYANPASNPICEALGLIVGEMLPESLLERVTLALSHDRSDVIEVAAGDLIYELLVASVYEFNSINLYGTDVTARRLVERTSRENERLLLNVLPAAIVQRLRDGEVVIADHFDEMTVMFADVVDFTPLSGRLSPTEIVDLLNRIFSGFDALSDRYQLEKIKTVGDAYMVVGGLTPASDDHAARVADMGLEMVAAVDAIGREIGLPLAIRVGLHVGPAVAGVIGIKKFIYDVWGDTVNTASRMESNGIPGRVQVTAGTAQRLAATHALERRGTVDVKGKGATETWLLVGRHARLGDDAATSVRVGVHGTRSTRGSVARPDEFEPPTV